MIEIKSVFYHELSKCVCYMRKNKKVGSQLEMFVSGQVDCERKA